MDSNNRTKQAAEKRAEPQARRKKMYHRYGALRRIEVRFTAKLANWDINQFLQPVKSVFAGADSLRLRQTISLGTRQPVAKAAY